MKKNQSYDLDEDDIKKAIEMYVMHLDKDASGKFVMQILVDKKTIASPGMGDFYETYVISAKVTKE